LRKRPEPNLLDRAIAFIDPIRGAKRMHARTYLAIAGGYTGARRDRPATKEWRLTNNSPDQDILNDLPVLRDRSRDLVRNAPLATGAVGTVVQNTVGGGLVLQAKPDWKLLNMTAEEAGAWSEDVEREFLLWAETAECDLERTQNFYGLQELAFRSTLESGDVIVLLPMISRARAVYSLRLQIIEADRLDSPRGSREGMREADGTMVSGGVRLDANGAPIAYHILKTHPGDPMGASRLGDWIPAWGARSGRRNVIHVFDRLRPGQHRGVPYLAPIIEPLKQLDRYTEAEITASVLSALFTVFVETEAGQGMDSTAGAGDTATEKKEEIRLGGGAIVDLTPGEKISSFAPNRPNQAFDGFVLAALRQIGTALGLPFEVLIKHFTASYSASRAAMLEAWRFFRGRREFLANQFCRPVYEAWMEEAVALGRVQAPGFFERPELRMAYLLSEWRGDAMSQIDPVKEVEAAGKRVELEVSTLEDETLMLTGKQWSDVHRQRMKEKEMQKRDGAAAATPGAAAPAGGPGPDAPLPVPPDQPERGDMEEARA
jgi:lambda family phage portal protein